MMGELNIPLPAGYRVQDVLAFHSRDAEGVAEQITEQGLRKGILLGGVPVLIDIAFPTNAKDATNAAKKAKTTKAVEGMALCRVVPDGELTAAQQQAVEDALLNMLGLRIDPAAFADFARADPVLGPILARQPGLRIVQSATVFEALTWAIIGQQINLSFAISLRRSLIQVAGRPHSSGLWCYPEASDVARLQLDELTSRKFSRAKAETVLRLAQLVDEGKLSLARDRDPMEVSRELLAVKGIGPWTVNYALLRGYGYPDCSLHGDVAVRTAFHQLMGGEARPDIAEAERLLERYKPHRTMAAAYLWASLSDQAG
ncbi:MULTISPECIES: DNA-3-methyladenine glycosylase 2 [unclassified Massilia]|uniref:DNA-3-methyladenine glycosylase 2 n=1 Tax=unclassified Massilia TaxID=2609279 RepID=UPI001B828A0F|nr:MULTISPECIES: DNA-3-methyladenine glycosylase 2 [unclassified Massilia]MBQ5939682.1 DNA-3-methyladenine glycosylase 2 [Massilia sp. AB1]MBQ5965338.1 DNA-3-methyladenine glycosylase 2 [Massilia sp. ZL223]